MVRQRTILRLSRCAASVLFVLGLAAQSAAQSFTIGGASSVTSQPGADFATTVLGDPWDFTERTDWVHMSSDNETPGSAGWARRPRPAASSAASRAASPLPCSCSIRASTAPSTRSARTASPRQSTRTATAASRCASAAASARPTPRNIIAAFWFPDTSQAGGGSLLWQAKGTYPASQHREHDAAGGAERRDLPRSIASISMSPLQSAGVGWSGLMKGLKVRLGWSAAWCRTPPSTSTGSA